MLGSFLRVAAKARSRVVDRLLLIDTRLVRDGKGITPALNCLGEAIVF
jgi:hypothetical protein